MGSECSLHLPDVRAVPVFVYALVDPRTSVVRYVGRSANPRNRLNSHCHRTAARKVYAWAEELRALGLRPQLVVLERVSPGSDSAPRELFWTEHFAEHGHLLNAWGSELANRMADLPVRGGRLGNAGVGHVTEEDTDPAAA